MKLLWPVAALVASAVVAVPAQAAAPVPVATVHGDCLDPDGAITLRLERVSADLTKLVITGSGLENGRWRGGYSSGAQSGPSEEVNLKVDVVDHEFRVEREVTGPSGDYSGVVLLKGRTSMCSANFFHGPRFEGSAGLGNAVFAMSRKSGPVIVRGYLACEDGSRWRWRIQAEFEDGWLGLGGHGPECRNNQVRIPWAELKGGRMELDRPDAVRLVAHSADGEVRRISYRLSS